MAERCGFGVVDGNIVQYDVEIAWDKGFDREAKKHYIEELHSKLGDGVKLEVTSASQNDGRKLSPFYIYAENGMNLEDFWKEANKPDYIQYYSYTWPQSMRQICFQHYYCIHATHLIDIIRKADIFTDVFYKPVENGLTQAKGCAILKALDSTNDFNILKDPVDFTVWYMYHVRR